MESPELTSDEERPRAKGHAGTRESAVRMVAGHLSAAPALTGVALMILWSAHDGGYGADTWYWGALALLSMLVFLVGAGIHAVRLPRSLKLALVALALYVAWSYLSITWANSPGDALTGSNRSLLYLLVVAAFALTPWTAARARAVLLVYVIGVGVIGALMLITMTGGDHSASLFVDGRLSSPTGYINSNAALFTTAAFVAIALAVDKTLAPPLRGVLVAIACGGIELALLAESRGWLFLLPVMLTAALAVALQRLRIATFAVLPALGALAILPTLLAVFKATEGAHPTEQALKTAAEHAGRAALLTCVIAFGTATLLAILETHAAFPAPSNRLRRAIGALAALAASAACISVGLLATHGRPVSFIDRQLNGSVSQLDTFRASHFELSGTGRFDIWRVSVDAVVAHPIGGLGQDNFVNYYDLHRHSIEEPRWTHSLELRLLVHTGVVGFVLFAAFLGCALAAALHSRRHAGLQARQLAGVALLPVVVWLIHGSVDWFWEIPALTGPALGFLAMAGALGSAPALARSGAIDAASAVGVNGGSAAVGQRSWRAGRTMRLGSLVMAAIALACALVFPYLSVREVSNASEIREVRPEAALRDLSLAAQLNPLSADPDRLAGTIALGRGRFHEAERRFGQATSRDPGGWFAWLGGGLAAWALGDSTTARYDLSVAGSINSRQPAVKEALRRLASRSPLTTPQAFSLLLPVP